jgi:hypothetical protein
VDEEQKRKKLCSVGGKLVDVICETWGGEGDSGQELGHTVQSTKFRSACAVSVSAYPAICFGGGGTCAVVPPPACAA